MAGLLDEPYIGYPQLRRSQSLLGGTPRGLLNTSSPQISADTLRKLGEQLINIPTSATRAITDPQLFARLLGITPNQQLSGFSAGYAGLPAKPPSDIGVVDPRNIDYSKGYSSGEEMGMMTALAAPLAPLARPVGKAVGEQAYRMTEDMLQRQGLMPSITAYHGTPYNIQGGFDISKIGTGEGAQAYGRGMYYAENPAVATEYQKRLSGKTTFGERPSDTAYINAVESFREANYPLEQIPAEMKKAYKSITDKDIQLAIQATEKGNLYKVDIPDEYVPNMLDWDKPLNQQPDILQNIKKLGEREDLPKGFSQALEKALEGKFFDGQDLYYELTKVYKDPSMLSKAMEESGFKGIRYADEGSRNWRILTPDESVSGKWTVGKWPGGGKEQKYFDNEKDAKEYFNQNYTSNFVVFDPIDVKILETNSQKVESLLD